MIRRFLIFTSAFLSVGIAVVSYRFLGLGLDLSFPVMTQHIEADRIAFLLHIVASPIALALGTFQFIDGLRQRHPALHRWSGRIYAVAILIGGIGSIIMVPNSNGGLVAASGFFLLAVLWLITTAQAVRLAMARHITLHRQWMVRSFALTFAAVSLRLQNFGFMAAGWEYYDAVQILAWSCWVPNILLAEWWIRRTKAGIIH